MYRLLIVDDDIHVVEGITFDLDLEKLGISELYTAFNVRQAKEVFQRHPVDILLCDIEMPQGSGLELLAWVNEHYPQTETVFVTSHADFRYAKEAIELGSLDYLLKPVLVSDLERAIGKATGKIHQTSEANHYHRLWIRHHPLIIESFWLDLLHRTIPSNPVAVKEKMAERNLPYTDRTTFLPVIVSVQRWHKELSPRDVKIMEYALRKCAEEIIVGSDSKAAIVPLDRGRLLLVFALGEGDIAVPEELERHCETYIDCCRRYFYCDLCCYIGKVVQAHEIPEMYENLAALEYNNVAFDNKVFLWQGIARTDGQVRLPDMNLWSTMLKSGAKERILNEAADYLDRLTKTGGMDLQALRQFQMNFLQMAYFVLSLRGIQAHQLFSDRKSTDLSILATRSVTDMMALVHHTVDKAIAQTEAAAKTNGVVEDVKKYIALNLGLDEMSRDVIAAQVFLNPDYLSRIFKKETGFSISDYVLQERIRVAKELLSKTDMPVSGVAITVGYSNFSHFTKIFKKYTESNPMEYRHLMQAMGASAPES
ncbi:response regulator [Bacillus sp. FJAT-28004]|uniref:response regulator n=1 Tax=Bacillus sp. FJAT-28004 TaxID=1679165 RepID=UPI0006B6646C|nr:response regulator [Bacillus sp. FJAT-28004]